MHIVHVDYSVLLFYKVTQLCLNSAFFIKFTAVHDTCGDAPFSNW